MQITMVILLTIITIDRGEKKKENKGRIQGWRRMMLVLMLYHWVLDNGSSISKKGIHTY